MGLARSWGGGTQIVGNPPLPLEFKFAGARAEELSVLSIPVGLHVVAVPDDRAVAFADGVHRERTLDAWFEAFVRALGTPVVYDVGAGIGYYTVVAARAGAHVYAIEPETAALDALRRNVERNELAHVVVRQDLLVGRDWLRAPDLIKIDLEGGDLRGLEGAAGVIDAHRPVVFVRYDREARSEAWLAARGYRLWGVTDVPGDLMVHAPERFAEHPIAHLIAVPEGLALPSIDDVRTVYESRAPLDATCEFQLAFVRHFGPLDSARPADAVADVLVELARAAPGGWYLDAAPGRGERVAAVRSLHTGVIVVPAGSGQANALQRRFDADPGVLVQRDGSENALRELLSRRLGPVLACVRLDEADAAAAAASSVPGSEVVLVVEGGGSPAALERLSSIGDVVPVGDVAIVTPRS
jgi:SAM-dependent methyltransferase